MPIDTSGIAAALPAPMIKCRLFRSTGFPFCSCILAPLFDDLVNL
jgi:hypothetical protein